MADAPEDTTAHVLTAQHGRRQQHPHSQQHRRQQQTRREAAHEAQTVFKNMVAGGMAGVVSRTTVAPLERTKILMQLHASSVPLSLPAVLRQMWQREGMRGMFRGNGTNIVRIVPYSAVQFAAYEGCKRMIGGAGTTTGERLACGAMAGIASVVVTYPLDVVRTRLSLPVSDRNHRKTITGWLCHIYRNEGGAAALYRGITPTVIVYTFRLNSQGIAPYVALNFTVYETLKGMAMRRKSVGNVYGLSVAERLAYGGIAGAVAQTVTYPLDVVRRRMQVANMDSHPALSPKDTLLSSKDTLERIKEYVGTVDAFKKIIKEEGIGGLYKGLLPNYLKVVPAIAVSFVTFESVKRLLD